MVFGARNASEKSEANAKFATVKTTTVMAESTTVRSALPGKSAPAPMDALSVPRTRSVAETRTNVTNYTVTPGHIVAQRVRSPVPAQSTVALALARRGTAMSAAV